MSKKYIKIDSQILDAFSACERKFQLSHIRNLRPIASKEQIQQGSICHDMVQFYYQSIKAGANKSNSAAEAIKFGRYKISSYDALDIVKGEVIFST